jgi:hypothetical protein
MDNILWNQKNHLKDKPKVFFIQKVKEIVLEITINKLIKLLIKIRILKHQTIPEKWWIQYKINNLKKNLWYKLKKLKNQTVN